MYININITYNFTAKKYNLLYAFNINGDHFKICLMVVGLTFVIYQMTSSEY